MATADATYFPTDLSTGVTRRLVTSTSLVPSDNGASGRLARRDFPLIEYTVTVNPDDADAIENLFITQNGPERSFLVVPPLTRDKTFTAQRLIDTNGDPASGTGTAAGFQLAIAYEARDSSNSLLFTRYIPVLHPVASSLTLYSNGAALPHSPNYYTLGSLGVVTVYAVLGQALTASFDRDIAMHFADDQLETSLDAKGIEFVRQVTIREALGE
jgi:hypothetical protein